jgi:hypothetical protein
MDNDTIHVKIINNTDSMIYVPKMYNADFTANDDTLHFGTINKPQYAKSYYYKYSTVFPFEFYTAKKINGLIPDTTVKIQEQYAYYNQFGIQPIVGVKPGSFYIEKIVFSVPKYTNTVQAIYYHKPFFDKNRIDTNNYTFDDVLRFDSVNAIRVNTPILIRYR